MGATKQLSNPTTTEYLKVTDNCVLQHIPAWKTTDDNGAEVTIKASVRFIIGYAIYENYQKRLESETNKWVKAEFGSLTVNYVPSLPVGWQPVDAEQAEAEKLIAMAYVALLAHPSFSDWVTYQP